MNSLSKDQIKDLAKDPEVRFQWKKGLVKRLLEEKIEKVVTEVDRKNSDAVMAQAESELTQPNGIEISGVVFFIPKEEQQKLSEVERSALSTKADQLALEFYHEMLVDPSDAGLTRTFQEVKKTLPAQLQISLKVDTKILARYEVVTPGWLFLAEVLDSHKNSNIDNVAPPVRVGTSVFVTVLRERIKADVLSVDVIRKRADVLGLAEKRKAAVINYFGTAVAGVSLELFPDVIQKDGSVE